MVEMKWPVEDFKKLSEQISLAATVLGKGQVEAVKWAAGNVCASLSGATKVSAQFRKIVKNPAYNKQTSKPREKWGVMRYKPKTNEKYFQPIYRFGNLGTYRIWNKSKGKWLTIDKDLGRRIKDSETLDDETAKSDPVLMKSKKRKILKRGLAKKSWQWARAQVLSGTSGNATIMDAPNIAEIKVTNGNQGGMGYVSFLVRNNLRYAQNAAKNGGTDVNYALLRAAKGMKRKIDDRIESALWGLKK